MKKLEFDKERAQLLYDILSTVDFDEIPMGDWGMDLMSEVDSYLQSVKPISKPKEQVRMDILNAVKEAAEELEIDEEDIEVYEDNTEQYSVGFNYKDFIACSIDLGFTNGVEKAFAYSYQDLEIPADGYEEFDTLEEAKDHLISCCGYCDENN